ncbi:MAG: RNA processing factor Prp31 [Patescibacteria group bacterium]|jgi:RNA processing factor Prp31
MEQEEIVKLNISEAKQRIKEHIKKDNLIIFFTRVFEDLKNNDNPDLLGRYLELYRLLNPYETKEVTPKRLYDYMANIPEVKEGLQLSDEERNYITLLTGQLNPDFTVKNSKIMKGRIKGMLSKITQEYLPESSTVIEPYLLGKLIGAVGGMQRCHKLPSSTIQLIGAEKATFRHMRDKVKGPKYGLLYYSKHLQSQPNKGKAARQLANKLAITLKVDYFRNLK